MSGQNLFCLGFSWQLLVRRRSTGIGIQGQIGRKSKVSAVGSFKVRNRSSVFVSKLVFIAELKKRVPS